jgi:CheY-like chemotaxis protein
VITILLVEDSADDVLVLRRRLDAAGVRNPVVVVGSGEEAQKYLRGDPPYADRARHPLPGILMLDLNLPGMDGFQILEWVRTQPHLKELQVFAVSGLDDSRSIRRAYELGANSYLAKPCKSVDVENLIHGFPQYWARSTPAPQAD